MTKKREEGLAETLREALKGYYKPSDEETIRLYVEANELIERLQAKIDAKLTASAVKELVKTMRLQLSLLKALGLTPEQHIESADELDRF